MRSFKKMGLLFMVLVIALAGIGVGFAAWTKTILIEGTVETGSVDLDFGNYSGTWVWKLDDDSAADWSGKVADLPQNTPGNLHPDHPEPVGSAVAGPGGGQQGDPDIVITFDKLFPCYWFKADFEFHYGGTVPAMLHYDYAWDDDNGWLGYLLTHVDDTGDPEDQYGAKIEFSKMDDTGNWVPQQCGVPIQMHYCDRFLVEVSIKLPQEDDTLPGSPDFNDFMNQSAVFEAYIGAIQWNKDGDWSMYAPTLNPVLP
jgi:hypothetical protein